MLALYCQKAEVHLLSWVALGCVIIVASPYAPVITSFTLNIPLAVLYFKPILYCSNLEVSIFLAVSKPALNSEFNGLPVVKFTKLSTINPFLNLFTDGSFLPGITSSAVSFSKRLNDV